MIKLSGILDYSMGGFLCLRGFASYKMLSAISKPDDKIQRDLIYEHKGKMADFLNSGEYRFFPEVILSTRLTDGTSGFEELTSFHSSLQAGQSWNGKIGAFHFSISQNVTKNHLNQYDPVPRADRIFIAHIKFDETLCKLIRIDGNHRLSAADEVLDDFKIPFCLLIFRNPEDNEQFSRAIFHNINAKQIPLRLEENLKVILDSPNVFPDDKLLQDNTFGPAYYLARKTIQTLDFTYFPEVSKYINSEKYSFFVNLYQFLLANGSLSEDISAVNKLKAQLTEIETALVQSQITATTTNIAVIGALAYYRLSNLSKYKGFLSWVKKNNIGNVKNLHIADVISLYDEIFEHIPKKIFLARWYPSADNANTEDIRKAESRIAAMKQVAQELNLELIDLGTRETAAFNIREVMYHNIRECDIFIADLTGARHNVMIEVGYALEHVKNERMLFYFQESNECKAVPFDVSHLNYVSIVDSNDIKTSVKSRIEDILAKAKNGEI